MYLMFNKSDKWHEGYKNVCLEDGLVVLCQPIGLSWWQEELDGILTDQRYVVTESVETTKDDEVNPIWIIREK